MHIGLKMTSIINFSIVKNKCPPRPMLTDHSAVCAISDLDKKSDCMNKISIFEISLISRFQKNKNSMLDSWFLPLWPHFTIFY